MPFTPTDANRHKKGLSPTQKRQWSHVANSVLKRCIKAGGTVKSCDGRAVRAANPRTGSPKGRRERND